MKRQIISISLLWAFFFITSQGHSSPLIDSGAQDSSILQVPEDGFPDMNEDQEFDLSEDPTGDAGKPMIITATTVTFDPKKKDKFTLKGTTGSLSLTGATSIILEAGSFKQEITLDKFTKSKEKYTFKGTTGTAGIANLILDMPKGQFSATVQNIFLTGFTNPLPISLTAGTSSECSMIQSVVNKTKWTFSSSSNPQYSCLITQTPQTNPRGLFVNKAKDIQIQVLVPSNSALDKNNVKLFRVDESLDPIGGSVCTLLDNGNPANGDGAAGDNIYSALPIFRKARRGR